MKIAAVAGTVGLGEVRVRGLSSAQVSPLKAGDEVRILKLRRGTTGDERQLWASAATEVWVLPETTPDSGVARS